MGAETLMNPINILEHKNAQLMIKGAALIKENENLKMQIKKLTAPKWWQFWK